MIAPHLMARRCARPEPSETPRRAGSTGRISRAQGTSSCTSRCGVWVGQQRHARVPRGSHARHGSPGVGSEQRERDPRDSSSRRLA